MREILIGAGASLTGSLAIAALFHWLATVQLRREVENLREQVDKVREQVDKVLAGLEEANLVELVRRHGRIVGIVKDAKLGNPSSESATG